MQKLSYFLWFCVVVAANYIVYMLLFHIYLKENDLTVITQNQRGFEVIKKYNEQERKRFMRTAKEQENSAKDSIILSKAQNIVNYIQIEAQDTSHLFQNANKTVAWVAAQDTSLQDLNANITYEKSQHPLQPIFEKNYLFHVQTNLDRLANKAVERLTAKIGSVFSGGFYRICVITNNRYIKEKEYYKAHFFYGRDWSYLSPKSVWLSEGLMKKDQWRDKYIYIPAVKVKKFPPTNKITKRVECYMVLYHKWNRDTTIYFSTTYTVKRKK